MADFTDLWKGTSFGNPDDYPEVGRYSVSLFGPSEYQYRLLPPHIEEAIKETEENLSAMLNSMGYKGVRVEFNREPLKLRRDAS
jgi:hypothetical protein